MSPNLHQHIEFYEHEIPPYRRFLLAPVGSWNYNCADEHSDTDVKAVFLPSIEDVIYNRCESKTHLFPNEEHLDFSDIRNFMKSLQKGNPQFIEVLFSPWIYPNDEFYGEEIHALLKMREDIARCNPQNTMRAMLGMADRNYQLCKVRTEEAHANKWLYQLTRIEEQMRKFMMQDSFENCLKTSKRDVLLEVKNNHWEQEKIISVATGVISKCTAHYEAYKDFFGVEEDKYIQRMIEEIVKQVCRKSIERVD